MKIPLKHIPTPTSYIGEGMGVTLLAIIAETLELTISLFKKMSLGDTVLRGYPGGGAKSSIFWRRDGSGNFLMIGGYNY